MNVEYFTFDLENGETAGLLRRGPGSTELRSVEIVSEEELRTLSEEELVALIVSRSNLDDEEAREALEIIRGGPPPNVLYERARKGSPASTTLLAEAHRRRFAGYRNAGCSDPAD